MNDAEIFEWLGFIVNALAAIGTVGAFATGGIILLRELRQARRRDASSIHCWYGLEDIVRGVVDLDSWLRESRSESYGTLGNLEHRVERLYQSRVMISSNASQPIYDVGVIVRLNQDTDDDNGFSFWAFRIMESQSAVSLGDRTTLAIRLMEPLLPGQVLRVIDFLTYAWPVMSVSLVFRDSSGAAWNRETNGTLSQMTPKQFEKIVWNIDKKMADNDQLLQLIIKRSNPPDSDG